METIHIRTSHPKWFQKLAEAYKNKTDISLFDDANVGIDPANDTLIAMGLKAKLSVSDWSAVGVAIGMSTFGMAMIILAFVDPEPTSKLGLLVGGGVTCVVAGGFSAIRILTKLRPPNVSFSPNGIHIRWE